MRPFLKGRATLLEKRGGRARYRERFTRLWVLLQVLKTPGIVPAGRRFLADSEQGLLLPYLTGAHGARRPR